MAEGAVTHQPIPGVDPKLGFFRVRCTCGEFTSHAFAFPVANRPKDLLRHHWDQYRAHWSKMHDYSRPVSPVEPGVQLPLFTETG